MRAFLVEIPRRNLNFDTVPGTVVTMFGSDDRRPSLFQTEEFIDAVRREYFIDSLAV